MLKYMTKECSAKIRTGMGTFETWTISANEISCNQNSSFHSPGWNAAALGVKYACCLTDHIGTVQWLRPGGKWLCCEWCEAGGMILVKISLRAVSRAWHPTSLPQERKACLHSATTTAVHGAATGTRTTPHRWGYRWGEHLAFTSPLKDNSSSSTVPNYIQLAPLRHRTGGCVYTVAVLWWSRPHLLLPGSTQDMDAMHLPQ